MGCKMNEVSVQSECHRTGPPAKITRGFTGMLTWMRGRCHCLYKGVSYWLETFLSTAAVKSEFGTSPIGQILVHLYISRSSQYLLEVRI